MIEREQRGHHGDERKGGSTRGSWRALDART
jgi:hypothetical protein